MSQFSDLNSVIKSLRYTILAPFIIILLITLFIWMITIQDLHLKHSTLVKQELLSSSKLFESILSQKLKIVAASPEFIKFMQSGKITREKMEISFLRQISKIYSPILKGMSIKNFDNSEIFSFGEKSSTYVTLTICYLNGNINSHFGNCSLNWTLYLNKNELMRELKNINKNIHSCNLKKCSYINIFNGHNFGDFLINEASQTDLKVTVNDSNIPINTIFFLFIFILLILGIWIYSKINKVIILSLSNPLSETIASLQNGSLPNSKNYIKEFKYLSDEIVNYYSAKETAKIGKIAGDFVHDLKPYICCLYELINKNKNFNYDDKNKIDKTLYEIELMMYSILDRYAHKNLVPGNSLQPLSCSVHDVFSDATEYAKLVCQARGVKLSVSMRGDCYSVFVMTNPLLFSRIFLNIVQNSIEAGAKNINIVLNCVNYSIEFTDDGCGIDQKILEKIGTKYVTHGKQNGHGIGLFEINKTIKSWGGSIKIDSIVRHGTTVILNFKKSSPPTTFIYTLNIEKYDLIIVIDDDEMIHKKWDSIFSKKITILTFFSPDQFISKRHEINTDNALFLIDQQFFKKCDISRVNFITINKLQSQAILVTNKPNDEFLISECVSQNIKILPKNNISIVPLFFT